jgi:hypothetical protein
MTTLQYEDSNCREKQIQIKKEKFAIDFALFLSEKMYENRYQDIDNDGKTWVNYDDEYFGERLKANRYTIEEILEIFKKR